MAIKPNLTLSLISQTQRILLPILFWPEAYNASGLLCYGLLTKTASSRYPGGRGGRKK